MSAKTRSWEQAERVAEAERDVRNPIRIKLREIAAAEATKLAAAKNAEAAKQKDAITVSAALSRWLANQKSSVEGTLLAYTTFTRKVDRWAKRSGMNYLSEVTSNHLDEWRGHWSKEAEHKDDQIGATTQSNFQGRLQRFFAWARGINLIESDPAVGLKYIKPSDKRTEVLTPAQFEELLASIDLFAASQTEQSPYYANELRALFHLQRWVGLRILDCLCFPEPVSRGNA